MDKFNIIGVDCAVDPRKTGLARAAWSAERLSEVELFQPRTEAELDSWILDRLAGSPRTLLALDSPLGWPEALGGSLSGHRAGLPIGADSTALFRRLTDQIVRAQTGKQPLEVGADRIARTAVAALDMLDRLGRGAGTRIELGWNPARLPRISAIETYPAAWLTGRGLPARRYKDAGEEAEERRAGILRWIEGGAPRDRREVALVLDDSNRTAATKSSHLLDALICTLCDVDFLSGRCRAPAPHERELAAKEGWVWFRDEQHDQARDRARRSATRRAR